MISCEIRKVRAICVEEQERLSISRSPFLSQNVCLKLFLASSHPILVPRGRAPFGQHQESRPLAVSNNGSPRFTDFPSLCACSGSSLTNLIGSGLNLLCLQIHSKPECRWSWPEVAILGADQKEGGLWGQECQSSHQDVIAMRVA